MSVIAWDLETIPKSLDEMTPTQLKRYEKNLERFLVQNPLVAETKASEAVRALHPFLGEIVCIAATRFDGKSISKSASWGYHNAKSEKELLSNFWKRIAEFKQVLWVSFNGKRFDRDFLIARTLHHKIQPTRTDILHENPYRHTPHIDLMNIFKTAHSLDDLCDITGVPSPKVHADGGQVYQLFSNNEVDKIAQYNEADTLATLQCYLKLKQFIPT